MNVKEKVTVFCCMSSTRVSELQYKSTLSINLLTVEVHRAVGWSVLCVEYCVFSLKCFVGAVCCHADYGGYLWLSVD